MCHIKSVLSDSICFSGQELRMGGGHMGGSARPDVAGKKNGENLFQFEMDIVNT